MSLSQREPANAATKLLAIYGARAIWDIHLAATAAHDMGKADLASSLAEIAEAAEEALLRTSAEPT